MKRDVLLGTILLILAAAVIAAMVVDNRILWFVVDLSMIATAGIGGLALILGKKD
jgi:hypothetical protein